MRSSGVFALYGKTGAQLRNGWRMLRSQSLFKWAFIALFAIAFELGLLAIFHDGFRFLNAFGGAGTMLIGRLFSLFFMAIGLMLSISGIVTAYSTIFRSDEIGFLMTGPLTVSQIAVYRFTASTALASWAFFFVVVPFIGAYTLHEHTSLLLPLWTFLFAIPFLFVFSAFGALAVLTAVRWAPRGRAAWFITAPLAVGLGALLWHISQRVEPMENVTAFNIARMVPGLRLAGNPLMPSWWTAEGIMAMSLGQWRRGLLLWGMLAATAALLTVIFEWLAKHWYYEAWQRVIAGQGLRRRRDCILPRVRRACSVLAHDTRALVIKDARIFLRDPLQWSQALVFFGLLGIYFANLRAFNYHALPDHWRNVIAFLNIFSVSAVLCSLGARFVYPQLSLEGHGFWMLGLAPTSMRRVLLTKFMTAAVAMSIVSLGLALLSTAMLDAEPAVRMIAILLTAAVSLAVCGLSTGLGAIFLDLDQRNPAAIVSGFGGTLNLVLNLVFMLVTILPVAALFQHYGRGAMSTAALQRALRVLLPALTLLTVATVAIPLALGLRSLEKRDF